MTQRLTPHEVTLGEWGTHAVILPARSFNDAVSIAVLLYGHFDKAPFHETQKLPPPPAENTAPPRLHDPERLIDYLAVLYNRLTDEAGPRRAAYQSELGILEAQIEHLQREGYGRLSVNLRLHDALVASRRQPDQIIAAGAVRRDPANPPDNAARLRATQTRKFGQFASAPANGPAAKAAPAPELRAQWQKLKHERGHALADPHAIPPAPERKTERTYFDRLAERARTRPAPLLSQEQDNGPEPA